MRIFMTREMRGGKMWKYIRNAWRGVARGGLVGSFFFVWQPSAVRVEQSASVNQPYV